MSSEAQQFERPFVVVTSINPPSEAVRDWASHLPTVVVADRKTPGEAYATAAATLLPFGDTPELSLAPVDHYARKNLGYLYAMRAGCDAILDTDDDTFPNADFTPGSLTLGRAVSAHCSSSEFVNVFRLRSDEPMLWPRGFPLDAIHEPPQETVGATDPGTQLMGIVQYLIDGDTDVDAVQRLLFGHREITFQRTGTTHMVPPGQFCPFNSQLTLFHRAAFPLLYLPSTVAFRFTDILRGVVAKRILDAVGLRMGFADSVGFQVRNPHNLMSDFENEVSCQVQTSVAWGLLGDLAGTDALALLQVAYGRLYEQGIVASLELERVAEWCDALGSIDGGGGTGAER